MLPEIFFAKHLPKVKTFSFTIFDDRFSYNVELSSKYSGPLVGIHADKLHDFIASSTASTDVKLPMYVANTQPINTIMETGIIVCAISLLTRTNSFLIEMHKIVEMKNNTASTIKAYKNMHKLSSSGTLNTDFSVLKSVLSTLKSMFINSEY